VLAAGADAYSVVDAATAEGFDADDKEVTEGKQVALFGCKETVEDRRGWFMVADRRGALAASVVESVAMAVAATLESGGLARPVCGGGRCMDGCSPAMTCDCG